MHQGGEEVPFGSVGDGVGAQECVAVVLLIDFVFIFSSCSFGDGF